MPMASRSVNVVMVIDTAASAIVSLVLCSTTLVPPDFRQDASITNVSSMPIPTGGEIACGLIGY